jgi:hypothetical protein
MSEVSGFDFKKSDPSIDRRRSISSSQQGRPTAFPLSQDFEGFASHYHAQIIKEAWRLDQVVAISPNTRDETEFNDPEFRKLEIPLFYPSARRIPWTK